MTDFGDIRQIAYLTNDIESAMQSWGSRSGVGPFTWYQNLTLNAEHRGEKTSINMEVGIAYRGNLQIELIQQTNDATSPYRDFFRNGQMGLHHLAYVTNNIDTSIKKAKADGFEITTIINAPIGRYAYFQDPQMPENYFEFLELTPDLESYWDQCIAEAQSWDGKNPIRVMDMSGI